MTDRVRNYTTSKDQEWKAKYFGEASKPKPQESYSSTTIKALSGFMQASEKSDRNSPYLKFDGNYLYWIDNDVETSKWRAMSGSYGEQCTKYQNEPYGPIPNGKWYVRQNNFQSRKDMSRIDKFIENHIAPMFETYNIPVGKWPGKEQSWGNSRIWLEPDNTTHTYGRKNFSIHGGNILSSNGCVDLAYSMDDFAN